MKPTEAQIQQTIRDIGKRLKADQMEKPINRAIKEGYTEVYNVLVEGRTNYDGIDSLRTVQGRAIAVLAVDYLNGEVEKHVLLGVPFKK
ncbi:hypothetical protein GCM10027592_29340 [Spirosoma flavus]